MIVFERRACAILYNILRSRGDARPWLLPANVCPDVPATFIEAGQPFLLVDLDPHSFEIDVDACQEHMTNRLLGGVVYVRAYGSEGDRTEAFARLKASQPDLFILDDKCLCRPDPDGQLLTPLADASLFSTGSAKYADLGSGAFAHLASDVPYDRHQSAFDAEALSEQERRCKRAVSDSIPFRENVPGWLDLRSPETTWSEYRARIAAHLEIVDPHKRSLNAIYETLLPNEIQMPARLQDWRFNILVDEPEHLITEISANGLFASRHYASLGRVFGLGLFPVAERLQARVVNLFNDFHFDETRAKGVAVLVLRHVKNS